ncbi:15121_t:CDS:1, partial [Funneliformis caledonium]
PSVRRSDSDDSSSDEETTTFSSECMDVDYLSSSSNSIRGDLNSETDSDDDGNTIKNSRRALSFAICINFNIVLNGNDDYIVE